MCVTHLMLPVAHKMLYDSAKVVHKRVTPRNLMVRCHDGRVIGVLADFDTCRLDHWISIRIHMDPRGGLAFVVRLA